MPRIIITGTPGTGKRVLALFLAKQLRLKRVDVHRFATKHAAVICYDSKNKTDVVDREKFVSTMEQFLKTHDNVVLDSHIIHYVSARYVDLCIVVRSSIETIAKRLKVRKYSAAKIKDNCEAEIFETCFEESTSHRQLVVDMTQGIPKDILKHVRRSLKQ